MGCGASAPPRRDDLEPPEQRAIEERERRRRRSGRGYLASDPDSLADYKRILRRNGALSSSDDSLDDDEVEHVLRKARDITVISISTTAADDNGDEEMPIMPLRSIRSALRSKHSSPRHTPTLGANDVSLRTSPQISRQVSFRVTRDNPLADDDDEDDSEHAMPDEDYRRLSVHFSYASPPHRASDDDDTHETAADAEVAELSCSRPDHLESTHTTTR